MEDGIISTRTYGLIEVTLTFGGVLIFCVYQLWSVRRAIAKRKAREAAATQDAAAVSGRRGMR